MADESNELSFAELDKGNAEDITCAPAFVCTNRPLPTPVRPAEATLRVGVPPLPLKKTAPPAPAPAEQAAPVAPPAPTCDLPPHPPAPPAQNATPTIAPVQGPHERQRTAVRRGNTAGPSRRTGCSTLWTFSNMCGRSGLFGLCIGVNAPPLIRVSGGHPGDPVGGEG